MAVLRDRRMKRILRAEYGETLDNARRGPAQRGRRQRKKSRPQRSATRHGYRHVVAVHEAFHRPARPLFVEATVVRG